MNYVYGRNRLAIKSIFKDKDITEEMSKFKGSFEPSLYIPRSVSIVDRMIYSGRFNKFNVHNFAMNMVIACNITYRNLLTFGHYKLDLIDPYKVKDDINTVLFSHVYAIYGNGTRDPNLIDIKELCDRWNNNFLHYYFAAVGLLNKNMDGDIPNEIIRNRFEHGYIYKIRKSRTEKEGSKRTDWSWLNNRTPAEIAHEIIKRGIHHDRKLENAFQKRNISITSVKDCIKYINDHEKEFVTECLIIHWIKEFNNKEIIRLYYDYYIHGTMDKDICITTLCNLGYKREWIDQFNGLLITYPIRNAVGITD